MNSLNFNNHICGNFPYYCSEILLVVKRLESARYFKREHLGYIPCIFEGTSKISWRSIIIKRLLILFRNFMCVTRIPYNLRSSLHMIPFFKSLHTNTSTLLTQKGGHPIIASKILKMVHSKIMQIKLISKSDAVVKKTTIMGGYLPSHLLLVTSVS